MPLADEPLLRPHHFIFNKDGKMVKYGGNVLPTDETTGCSPKKKGIGSLPYMIHKNNSVWIREFNVRAPTIKLLEETTSDFQVI